MKILYIKTCDVAKQVLQEMIIAQNVYTFKNLEVSQQGAPHTDGTLIKAGHRSQHSLSRHESFYAQ